MLLWATEHVQTRVPGSLFSAHTQGGLGTRLASCLWRAEDLHLQFNLITAPVTQATSMLYST